MDRRKFLGAAVSASALALTDLTAKPQAAPSTTSFKASAKPAFEVRAFEIHSRRAWQWKSVSSAFAFMQQFDLNTLIFNQNDLTDTVVWPDKYYPMKLRYERWPTRMSNTENAVEYLRNVAREAAKRNIKFFFEVKEIWYPDGLVELHPEVMDKNGAICPNSPFWFEFLRTKYTELFENIPELAGVIVSPGSRESKVSISTNKCSCEHCENTTPLDWYTKLLGAMYEPIQSRGKTLVVRDFAFTKEDQDLVVNACTRMSKNIVLSLKAEPHDFYPTFPNNPRIGNVGDHPQWIEYDCWGQFFGQSLFPCGVVEDAQKRLAYCAAHGAVGVQFRTDIEWETEASVFNSFNLLNLVAGALFSQNTTRNIDDAYRAWLQIGLLDVMVSESEQPPPAPMPPIYFDRLKTFMKASWSIMEKTSYVRGFLFNGGAGMFVPTVEEAFFYMKVMHGRDDWEPGASIRIEPTEENIAVILAEKDAALAEVQKLPGILQVDSLPITKEFKEHLNLVLTLYHQYVRGVRLTAIACFRAQQAQATHNAAAAHQALNAADDIEKYRKDIATLLDARYYPHYVFRAFDLSHLDSLIPDIRRICLPLTKP